MASEVELVFYVDGPASTREEIEKMLEAWDPSYNIIECTIEEC